MIRTMEQKEDLERVCRPPYVYHWGVEGRPCGRECACGQIGGDPTTIREIVNCIKCRRILGDYIPRPVRGCP